MFEPIEIAVKRLDGAGDLPLPSYETSGSAGMDVCAAEAATIVPGSRSLVSTGFAFAFRKAMRYKCARDPAWL